MSDEMRPTSDNDSVGIPSTGTTAVDHALTLVWLTEHLGNLFVEYLLNCDRETAQGIASGEIPPIPQQGEILNTVASVRQSLPAELDEASVQQVIAGWIVSSKDNSQPVSWLFHTHAGGGPTSLPLNDSLERSLCKIADEVFPAFLLPDELPDAIVIPGKTGIHAIRAIFGHPESKIFFDQVRKDEILGPFFSRTGEHTGVMSETVYRSVGAASGVQLAMLPEILLGRAWNGMPSSSRTPGMFVKSAVSELRSLRKLIKTKQGTTTARIAFTGILLPEGARIKVGDGVIREVNPDDRRFAPRGLEGKLSGTDSDGVSTTVNYDGDVLLELPIPLRIRIQSEDLDMPGPWPEDMYLPQQVSSTVERVRFALMLSMERESRAHLIPTWQRFDDPFSTFGASSWSDPRNSPGIMPYSLTEQELAAWDKWLSHLGRDPVRRIDLAIGRILRAAAERRDPADVLIDSVISWENLFGTKEGEPTFRISTCLAVLLEATLEDRETLKSRISKIYSLRSKVVHGSAYPKQSEYALCYEALDIAISAVRTLVQDRTDVLDLADGAQRSSRLLLGG